MRNELLAGKRGLMCHYLPPQLKDETGLPYPARPVDFFTKQFQVDTFVSQVKESRSHYLIFTLGQNSGFYNAPNPVLESYAGREHCSRRDLFGEIAEALQAEGIFTIAYLPCEINANRTLHQPLAWNTAEETDQAEFQKRYLEIIRCWAQRYGKLLSGWWYDGCYPWKIFRNRHLAVEEWLAASRAGNPDAVVTFNDGCYLENNPDVIFEQQDYVSGECLMVENGYPVLRPEMKPFCFQSPYATSGKALRHILMPIDGPWCDDGTPQDLPQRLMPPYSFYDAPQFIPPVYTDEELNQVIARFCGIGAAATFNVGIRANGAMGPRTIAQLGRLSCGKD